MLKHYIKRKKDEGISKDTKKDLGVKPVKVGVGIRQKEEKYNANDDEWLWAPCHQKEDVRDIQFGVDLTKDQQKEMMKILETYKGVCTDVPRKSNLIEHRIIISNENPVRTKPYPLPYAVLEKLKREIKDKLESGIIRESELPDASPTVIVKKKDESYLCRLSQVEQLYLRWPFPNR